jgi:17beta-estradiol 17-dehydrogenase / very-long-chain 3-oxoacyl-CoA reductase
MEANLLRLPTCSIVITYIVYRRSGLILNLGSFSGLVATPYLSVYSAGKAFLSTWSQALGTELAPDGIVVEHINTYFVVSAMSKIRRPTFLIPMPKPYVASVLSKIGLSGGSSTPYGSTPYLSQALLNWLIDNLFTTSFWVKQNNGNVPYYYVCVSNLNMLTMPSAI